ncbi:hypothetical protein GVAV_001890 [Gurleya vavrai]
MKKEGGIGLYLIYFYFFITIVEQFIYGLSIRLKKKKTEGIYDDRSIFLEHVFIIEGLMNKNIYQVNNYPRLSLYTICLAALRIPSYIKGGINLVFVFIAVLVLDFSITLYFYSELEQEYKWFYYKKFGLTDVLQEAYKTKQQMFVFFKLDVICNLISILYPYGSQPKKKTLRIINYILSGLNVYFFSLSCDSENYLLRVLTMLIVFLRSTTNILDIISFSFAPTYSTVFIVVAAVYTIYNDFWFFYFLYKDMMNFGKGLQEALNKNAQNKHFELE